MTTKEKAEKVLFLLYDLKKSGKNTANPIAISSLIDSKDLESRKLGKYLKDNGWINGREIASGYAATLTIQGEIYVEENLLKKDRQPNFKPLKTKEKYDIILSELYSNYGKFIEVSELLQDYQETSLDEAIDLGKALESKGYVNVSYSKSNSAVSITSLGREYVEDNIFQEIKYEPSDMISKEEQREFSKKLDEVIERLKNLELGQQIIYDDIIEDINDLKSLLNVLGKKDWKQLFLGKLFDAGLGTIADNVYQAVVDTFKDQNLLN